MDGRGRILLRFIYSTANWDSFNSWKDDFDEVINTIRKKRNDVAHPGEKSIHFSDVEEMRSILLGPFQHKEFPEGVIAYFNELLG